MGRRNRDYTRGEKEMNLIEQGLVTFIKGWLLVIGLITAWWYGISFLYGGL